MCNRRYSSSHLGAVELRQFVKMSPRTRMRRSTAPAPRRHSNRSRRHSAVGRRPSRRLPPPRLRQRRPSSRPSNRCTSRRRRRRRHRRHRQSNQQVAATADSARAQKRRPSSHSSQAIFTTKIRQKSKAPHCKFKNVIYILENGHSKFRSTARLTPKSQTSTAPPLPPPQQAPTQSSKKSTATNSSTTPMLKEAAAASRAPPTVATEQELCLLKIQHLLMTEYVGYLQGIGLTFLNVTSDANAAASSSTSSLQYTVAGCTEPLNVWLFVARAGGIIFANVTFVAPYFSVRFLFWNASQLYEHFGVEVCTFF